MREVDIKIKPLDPAFEMPRYMHAGDAGMDLVSMIEVELGPLERAVVPCGFSLSFPDGYAALVLPRSGLATKHGITVANAPGLIDSGYRGEVKAALVNLDSQSSYKVCKGDRIAQLLIVEAPHMRLSVTESLEPSERGSGGFGSSGSS